MKKNLSMTLLFISFLYAGYAQYMYMPGTEVVADHITYKVVDTGKYTMILENADNKLCDTLYYENGTLLADKDYEQIRIHPASGAVAKALMNTFTEMEYEKLREIKRSMVIYCYISPDGKLLELSYLLLKEWAPYISPEKFALLERNLKKYLTFRVNDFGKQLQYVHGPLFVNFSRIELPYVSFDMDNQLDADARFRQPVDFLNNERVMD